MSFKLFISNQYFARNKAVYFAQKETFETNQTTLILKLPLLSEAVARKWGKGKDKGWNKWIVCNSIGSINGNCYFININSWFIFSYLNPEKVGKVKENGLEITLAWIDLPAQSSVNREWLREIITFKDLLEHQRVKKVWFENFEPHHEDYTYSFLLLFKDKKMINYQECCIKSNMIECNKIVP